MSTSLWPHGLGQLRRPSEDSKRPRMRRRHSVRHRKRAPDMTSQLGPSRLSIRILAIICSRQMPDVLFFFFYFFIFFCYELLRWPERTYGEYASADKPSPTRYSTLKYCNLYMVAAGAEAGSFSCTTFRVPIRTP